MDLSEQTIKIPKSLFLFIIWYYCVLSFSVVELDIIDDVIDCSCDFIGFTFSIFHNNFDTVKITNDYLFIDLFSSSKKNPKKPTFLCHCSTRSIWTTKLTKKDSKWPFLFYSNMYLVLCYLSQFCLVLCIAYRSKSYQELSHNYGLVGL